MLQRSTYKCHASATRSNGALIHNARLHPCHIRPTNLSSTSLPGYSFPKTLHKFSKGHGATMLKATGTEGSSAQQGLTLANPNTQASAFSLLSISSAALATLAIFLPPELLLNAAFPASAQSALDPVFLRIVISSAVEYCLQDAAENGRLSSATPDIPESAAGQLLKHTWSPGFLLAAAACINLKDAADRGRLSASTFKRLNLGIAGLETAYSMSFAGAMFSGMAPTDLSSPAGWEPIKSASEEDGSLSKVHLSKASSDSCVPPGTFVSSGWEPN
ncbi:hypothetical protein DUNSADRAFT_2144 [Dunaliella salina]|uniref:Uncharacterized protein n=1 Tax=Dunaliella salina TaxID=3046 RepID=A0ABQ7H8D9_DUNSA|nr:hypothetical protein DUNSADRAFT_2144 [Dunaliella salina]|eukprot:KAF5843108.1 hypothetical protein DUNSADRAFT_2144 [Dunaliella salina]